MLVLLAINFLIFMIATVANKFSVKKKYILENIIMYSLGQFNLYILLPFTINGNLSTVIFVKTIFTGAETSVLDIIALLVFNIFQVLIFILQFWRPKSFGEFRSEFLRYDISQEFYKFYMLMLFGLSMIFGFLFGTTIIAYCCFLPIVIFAGILVFNKLKSPYLQNRHCKRSYILYGLMTSIIIMIQIQNLENLSFLKEYLPLIILIL